MLESNFFGLRAGPVESVSDFVPQERGIAQVLVDGVCGHLGNVLCCLGLNIESDETVCNQIMNRLETFFSHKVLSIMKESVV